MLLAKCLGINGVEMDVRGDLEDDLDDDHIAFNEEEEEEVSKPRFVSEENKNLLEVKLEKKKKNVEKVKAKNPSRKRLFVSDLTAADLTCSKCNKIFPVPHKLREHELIHSDTFPFNCEECGRGFNNKYKMRSHVKLRHGGEKRETATAKKPDKSNLLLLCGSCGKTFRSKSGLRHHTCSAHDEVVVKVKAAKPVVSLKCPKCSVICGSRRSLRVHDRSAHQDPSQLPHVCPHCRRGFLKRSYLSEHVDRFHRSEPRFACSQCEKKCATKQDLNRHVKSIHAENSSQGNFRCDFCAKAFNHRATYKGHLRAHLGERPYRCVPCGSSFGLLGVLRKHQLSHQRKGDRTKLISAPKGKKGFLSYIDFDHQQQQQPPQQQQQQQQQVPLQPPPPQQQQVYIPSGQYIPHRNPPAQMQFVLAATEEMMMGSSGGFGSQRATPVQHYTDQHMPYAPAAPPQQQQQQQQPQPMSESESIAMDIMGLLSETPTNQQQTKNLDL